MDITPVPTINDLPYDVMWIILKKLLLNAADNGDHRQVSLLEVVEKGFISAPWAEAVSALIISKWQGTGTSIEIFPRQQQQQQSKKKGSMLKLFEGHFQLSLYNELVIIDACLHLRVNDPRLLISTSPWSDWRLQDHLCLSGGTIFRPSYNSSATFTMINRLAALFDVKNPETSDPPINLITGLVVGTCGLKLNLVQLLRAFPRVDSLTLLELPDSRRLQANLWAYLGGRIREKPLRQLHIFHQGASLALVADQVAPIFGTLQALTLHEYRHPNGAQLLNALSGHHCRRLLFKASHRPSTNFDFGLRWWVAPEDQRDAFGQRLPRALSRDTFERWPLKWHWFKECEFIVQSVRFDRYWAHRMWPRNQHLPRPHLAEIVISMLEEAYHEFLYDQEPPYVPINLTVTVTRRNSQNEKVLANSFQQSRAPKQPPPPFTLSFSQLVHVTLWLKKMAFLVGFGTAETATFFQPSEWFAILELLFPRFQSCSTQSNRGEDEQQQQQQHLQKLVHFWRAFIRQLDQQVERLQKQRKRNVLISKHQLLKLFINLYYQFYSGRWRPPFPFYFHHSPTSAEDPVVVDPLKPWIVIWTMVHGIFELGTIGTNDNDHQQIHLSENVNMNSDAYQTSVNEINNFAMRFNQDLFLNDIHLQEKTHPSFHLKFN